MRSKVVGVQECWVEVKPLITSKLEPRNFRSILEALFNCAEPFKFLIINTSDENIKSRQLVRFLIQFPNEQMRKQTTNVIKAVLNVEVTAVKPPQKQFPYHVDLELAKNYALPICNFQEEKGDNLADRIVATVASSDTAIEVTVQGDRKAIVGIQNYIYEKTVKPHRGKPVFDQAIDIIVGIIFYRNMKSRRMEQALQYRQQSKREPWLTEAIKNAEAKLHSSLFTCQIRIYGNSLDKIQTAKNALPSFINYFKNFRTIKKQAALKELKKPSRYILRNSLLSRLWWITPMGFLLLANLLGLFDPLQVISAPKLTGDLIVLGVAGWVSIILHFRFRKRHPIVLSAQELSQIIGLPAAVGKLPVAVGQVPPTRMQLGAEDDLPEHQANQQIISQSAASKQDRNKTTLTMQDQFTGKFEKA